MASELSVVKIKQTAERYITKINLLKEGNPEIYQLPLQAMRSENKGNLLTFRFGMDSRAHNVKSIMILGATGSGKTTLIDSMVNYILGVEWKDKFRYKLLHQDETQTSSVTAFELNHQEGFRVPYSLIIVDTPGFGDTRGIERDNEITEQIREFFTSPDGVDQIDVVCFVVQASLPRLTPTQKNIIDSVLSIFGKDIEENIRVMVTFADEHIPPVLEAINQSGIPCPKDNKGRPIHFKFNNSVTLAQTGTSGDCDSDEEKFDEMFWKMGSTNMKRFFAALDKMPSKSLRLTKEVLQERKQLDVTVQGLHQQVKVHLSKLEEIKNAQAAFEKHKAEVEKNIDFEYEVEAIRKRETKVESTVLNCEKCKTTCHVSCDGWKWFCPAKDWLGKCRVCPGKCASSCHKLEKYKFEYFMEREKRTHYEVKAQYDKAYGEKLSQEKLKKKLEEEVAQIEDQVQKLVKILTDCLARLDEIALKPNSLSNLDYVDLMIQMEKKEGKPGFQERIESLNHIKGNVELLAKVAKEEPPSPEENKSATAGKEKPNKLSRKFGSEQAQ